jgi:hypothetical protein
VHVLTTPVRTGRFHFDLATATDESALREFARGMEMPGAIRFVFEREPDYFDALRVEGRESEVLVCREAETGRVVAAGHRSIKLLFVNGEVSPAGYLSGLRLEESVRNGRILARGYAFLRERHADQRAPFYLTTIMEDNEHAKAILLSGRGGLPRYHDFGRFCCMAVGRQPGSLPDPAAAHVGHEPAGGLVGRDSFLRAAVANRRVRVLPDGAHGVTRPTLRFMGSLRSLLRMHRGLEPDRAALPRVRADRQVSLGAFIGSGDGSNANIRVRRATPGDGPGIVEFLRREGRSRQFFPQYDLEDFGTPGGLLSCLAWEDVFVAFRGGELVGVLAAWDQRPFRQWRITGYAPWLRFLRTPFNLVSALRGIPPLPRAGAPLDYFVLSLICVRQNDRAVFAALLDEVMREKRHYAFFLAGLHERDPLLPELLARPHFPLPSRLYVVAWEDGEEAVRTLDRRLVPYLELGSL